MRKLSTYFLAFFVAFSAWVQAEDTARFVEGKHYRILPSSVATRDDGKIEVIEMFWYGCPHCYDFDPLISKWSANLPADVDFWHSPAAFSPKWKTHAQAFYAAEALGVGKELHQPLFDALARDHKPLNSESALSGFFAKYGIPEEKFKKAYNSFSVKSKVEQSVARGKKYRLTGVPALIVNGKYRIDAGQVGGFKMMLEVADYLIEKERQVRAASS